MKMGHSEQDKKALAEIKKLKDEFRATLENTKIYLLSTAIPPDITLKMFDNLNRRMESIEGTIAEIAGCMHSHYPYPKRT